MFKHRSGNNQRKTQAAVVAATLKTALFRALLYCMDVNERSKPYGAFTQSSANTPAVYLLGETPRPPLPGNPSVRFVVTRIMSYTFSLVCAVCCVRAKHIASRPY